MLYNVVGDRSDKRITVTALPVTHLNVTVPIRINTDMFGHYTPNTGKNTIMTTALRLYVVGILAGTNNKDSHAIIRTDSGLERVYGVGETLPGGAVVLEIHEDGVIIRYQGRVERLVLPRADFHQK